MAESDQQVAVLFAVVCGSARLYETLGDDRAHRRIADCAETMAATVADHCGRVVKTADAEMLAVLPDANAAYLAASEISESQQRSGLPVRIGFHVGPVIEVAGDVFGDTVNMAARLAALARSGEVLLTDAAVLTLTSRNRGSTRLLDRETTVKGKSEPITVHEIAVPDQDMTVIGGVGAPSAAAEMRLELRFKDRRLTVDGQSGKISIGRVDDNDLVVPDTAVSRHHATIEGRRGHFHVCDTSTNGTYVQVGGRSPILLKRDTLPITGSGCLSLGQAPQANPDHLIWFEAVSS